MYDIAIIGSGPAGSTLARLIGEKYKVLLIDKRDLDNSDTKSPINKCCGGRIVSPGCSKNDCKARLRIT